MDSNDQVVDDQQVDDQPQADDQPADRTDWKAKAIEWETKYKSENGIRRRLEKDVKQYSQPKPPTDNQPQDKQDKKGFDYSEKAYLKASGIENEDFDLVKQVMEETGKDLDAVLASKYFQAEVAERKAFRMSDAATPPSGKRTAQSAKDSVDYWIAKGELPPADQPELRRQVVNAKIAAQNNKTNIFGSAPDVQIK